MNPARFFVSQKIPEGSSVITLADASAVHQIKNVLRKKEGGEIILLDNSGYEYLCIISGFTKTTVELELIERILNGNEPLTRVTLYQSIVKKDKMEWVFEKCTEIGVAAFVPVLSEHSVKLGMNAMRAQKIIQEAAEQSRRGLVPVLSGVISFSEALVRATQHNNALNILAHNNEKLPHVNKVLADNSAAAINLFIGPEGGFSEAELQAARSRSFTLATLGKRTLRSETAAVAASLFTISYI